MPTLYFQQLSSRRTNRISQTPELMDQDRGTRRSMPDCLTGLAEVGCHPEYSGTKCIPSIGKGQNDINSCSDKIQRLTSALLDQTRWTDVFNNSG